MYQIRSNKIFHKSFYSSQIFHHPPLENNLVLNLATLSEASSKDLHSPITLSPLRTHSQRQVSINSKASLSSSTGVLRRHLVLKNSENSLKSLRKHTKALSRHSLNQNRSRVSSSSSQFYESQLTSWLSSTGG